MSTLRTNTLSNVAGTKTVSTDTVVDGSAKAWVNFNGTGTVAIRGSFNVSSITDNGLGNYFVNFATAMPNTNYCTQISMEVASNGSTYVVPNINSTAPTVNFTPVLTVGTGGTTTSADSARICVAVFS
jgi:hypothetical protein